MHRNVDSLDVYLVEIILEGEWCLRLVYCMDLAEALANFISCIYKLSVAARFLDVRDVF